MKRQILLFMILMLGVTLNSCKKKNTKDDSQDNTPGKVFVTVDLEGNPAPAGITIYLFKNNTEKDSKQTDSQGKVTFENVAPGSYQLRASHTNYVGEQNFDLSSGEQKHINFSLGST